MNGPPAKPIKRHVELAHQQPHRLQHVRHVGLGLERPQPVEVGRRPERLGHDRPRRQVDVDPDGRQRDDDVGEQDGGVDPQPPHRLHRHLGRQLRACG